MVNHLCLQGLLVADPELKDTNNGTKVVNFRVAWSEKFKERENKLFLECKAFSGLAEHIAKYFVKGQEIAVEGKLNTEEWEKDGQKRSKIVLMVSDTHFCGKKESGTTTAAPAKDPSGGTVVETEELPF
jgi:single-strand DNA-binding protein